jgi:hypothetical protein
MTESFEGSAASRRESLPVNEIALETSLVQAKSVKAAPSLSAYFEKKMPAAAFAKVVRKAPFKRFGEADCAAALELMLKNDRDGERLWKLMSLPKLPMPLNAWIWMAAEQHLVQVLGAGVDLAAQSQSQLVDLIRRRFPALSATRGKADTNAFVSSVRIMGSWLLHKHRLASEVIELISVLLCQNEKSMERLTLDAIRTSSNKKINVVVSIWLLARSDLAERERERERANNEISALRKRLESAFLESTNLRAQLEDFGKQNADLSLAFRALERQLETERQHSGYDYTELKATNAMLLRDRLTPLIRDAIDALEIEAPAPDLAVRRLRLVMSTIEEHLQ